MPNFIPGLELANRYYIELVQPLLDMRFPDLRHAAALIGYGSEVLGFDTPMSMDHAWAPRLQIFLAESDLHLEGEIDTMLRRELPTHLLDFPLGTQPSAEEPGVFFMDEATRAGDVAHKVTITSLKKFVMDELDWDMNGSLEPADWLTFPAQVLSVLTAGRVFHDDVGELSALRARLAFYPREIWLYLLACGWDRIGQEDALLQRAGYVGDELGSAIMGSRLARDVMSLCFLMERQYAPYPKWFGSAFKRLECAGGFSPLLWQVQTATDWMARARALGATCELLARKQNALGLTAPLPETVSSFHGRPFDVIHADLFCKALLEAITDPEMRRIAAKGPLGSIDQFSDNTVLRSGSQWRKVLKELYI